jgi:hypothetical protein
MKRLEGNVYLLGSVTFKLDCRVCGCPKVSRDYPFSHHDATGRNLQLERLNFHSPQGFVLTPWLTNIADFQFFNGLIIMAYNR